MILLLIAFVVLLCLNMPIAFVIGIAGIAYFLTNGTIPLSVLLAASVPLFNARSVLDIGCGCGVIGLSEDNIDGLLIGGASLKPQDFAAMTKCRGK